MIFYDYSLVVKWAHRDESRYLSAVSVLWDLFCSLDCALGCSRGSSRSISVYCVNGAFPSCISNGKGGTEEGEWNATTMMIFFRERPKLKLHSTRLRLPTPSPSPFAAQLRFDSLRNWTPNGGKAGGGITGERERERRERGASIWQIMARTIATVYYDAEQQLSVQKY